VSSGTDEIEMSWSTGCKSGLGCGNWTENSWVCKPCAAILRERKQAESADAIRENNAFD